MDSNRGLSVLGSHASELMHTCSNKGLFDGLVFLMQLV